MSNHLIYQDNDIKVEILGEFHNLLKKIGIPSNRLSEVQFNILLKCIFHLLEEKNFPVKNKKVIACCLVPVIQQGKIIEMSEMFSDFKFAFQVLSSEGKCTPEIKDFIDEHYAADKVIFDSNFFEEPVYTVSGYFAMIKENNLLITLFTLDEKIEDSD